MNSATGSSSTDGCHGISRERARLDGWLAELLAIRDRRVWLSDKPERFKRFRDCYLEELRGQWPRLSALRGHARQGTVTLLCAARDRQHDNATVLAEVLRRRLSVQARASGDRKPSGGVGK